MLRYLNGYDFYPTGDASANGVADGFFGRTDLMMGVQPGRFDRGRALQTSSYPFSGASYYEPVGHRFTTANSVLGVAVRIPASTIGLPNFSYGLGFWDAEGGVDEQMTVIFTDAGLIRAYLGPIDNPNIPPTICATTEAGAYNYDEWFWLELKTLIHPTDGLFEVRVNTVTKISYIGPTAYGVPLLGAAPGWDTIRWLNPANNSGNIAIYWDDVYVLDDTGPDNNDYLGNVRVNTQFTVGVGDLTQFSRVGSAGSNWDTVNGTALDDTEYVYDGTVGQKDLYTMDPNVVAQNIFGVQVRGAYRQDDSTQMVARNILKTGGTIYEGSDHYLSGSYKYYKDIWEKNPGTGVGWTSSELNAIQAGTKVQA